jgi:hypothetical protein
MSRSALVETLTAAATAMLGTALAAGCSSAPAEAVPRPSEPTRVEIALPTGKQVVAETWQSFIAHHPEALMEPASHVELDNGALMYFERSKAFVFLTAAEDRALPRPPASFEASADCCDDIGLETISCDGPWCNCRWTACEYPGRPFVVDEVTRVAGVEPRDGWA